MNIPRRTQYVIKEGMTGTPVWAVQRVLNKLGYPTSEDSAFGPQTKKNVKRLQSRLHVADDGVVGPATQGALGRFLCARQESVSGLPQNLLWSKISYESGGLLAAVNWSVPGGVDCGMTQRRVYDGQYDDQAAVKRAFDAVYQVDLSGDRVAELYGIFFSRPGTKCSRELAYRLAVLNHNYPSLADAISRYGVSGLSSYYTSRQSWVTTHGLRFPDGTPIETPLQWGQRYSLGNEGHLEPGQAVKLVESWAA